jgi:hypothetical protein
MEQKWVVNDTRSGRPTTTVTDVNIDEAEPQKQIVNGVYCANTLTTHLRNTVGKEKGPELLMNGWFLLQDNAQPHFAHLTTDN